MLKLLNIPPRTNRSLAVSDADFLGRLFDKHVVIEWWTVSYFWNKVPGADDYKRDRSDIDGEDIAQPTSGLKYYSNQTNLAIKGIIAVGAMSKMSSFAEMNADADRYSVRINLSHSVQ